MYKNPKECIQKAQSLLTDALNMCDDRMDVVDGEDGQPRPDAWMQMNTLLENVDRLLSEALNWGND